MPKKSLNDITFSGQRTLVRVDFNVPLDHKDGVATITDDTRIKETLPTIQKLISGGAKILLTSHLGRPKGKPDPAQSLAPVANHLSTLLQKPVHFFPDDITNPQALSALRQKISALQPGDLALLENIRFYPGEEKNDPALAKSLASLCDIYVNDAFGSAHRAHASTEGVAHHVPIAVAGLLMERELAYLGGKLENPEHPFVVILGGAKVSDKIAVIDRLLEKADTLLIGGGMAYTFKHALGQKIGRSLCEPDHTTTALSALQKAKQRGVELLLPIDNLITDSLNFDARTVGATRTTTPGEPIPDGWEGVDIGPETIKLYASRIATAKTILWNGPMGVFEIKACAEGTFAIARAIAQNTAATSIIGGGDSVKAVKRSGCADKVTFMSTGGGASLEFLEGKTLPGVAALHDK